jgi:hypothetical protein
MPFMPKTPAEALVQMKRRCHDYDLFTCYDHADIHALKKLAVTLQLRGVLPWFDEWETSPLPLAQDMARIKAVAVCVGQSGVSPWQDAARNAILHEFLQRGCPVIPIILPDCKHVPDLPDFLAGTEWVDFRRRDPNPFKLLVGQIPG